MSVNIETQDYIKKKEMEKQRQNQNNNNDLATYIIAAIIVFFIYAVLFFGSAFTNIFKLRLSSSVIPVINITFLY